MLASALQASPAQRLFKHFRQNCSYLGCSDVHAHVILVRPCLSRRQTRHDTWSAVKTSSSHLLSYQLAGRFPVSEHGQEYAITFRSPAHEEGRFMHCIFCSCYRLMRTSVLAAGGQAAAGSLFEGRSPQDCAPTVGPAHTASAWTHGRPACKGELTAFLGSLRAFKLHPAFCTLRLQ